MHGYVSVVISVNICVFIWLHPSVFAYVGSQCAVRGDYVDVHICV